jgi:hypothetical protein
MSSMTIGWVVFGLVFGSALLTMALHGVVPEHHLSTDSKDVVKLGIAVIATMSALVLSLLIASAKGSYDIRSREFTQMTASIILLDRLLAHYGPETKEVRDVLHRSVVDALDRIGSSKNLQLPMLAPTAATPQGIYSQIQRLSPQNEAQRSLQAEALKMAVDMSQTRWLLLEQGAESSIPMPFLVVLVLWLCIIFASFGLYAPHRRHPLRLRFVGFGSDLPDPGAGPPVRGPYSDLPRSAAKRHRPAWSIDLKTDNRLV